jgi:hypothetical protein
MTGRVLGGFSWLERGDHLQRIVDIEAEVSTLHEDVDVGDIERLTLLQNIAEMQQQVEEAEVQIAALQAIVALRPLPPVQAPPKEQQGQSGLDQTSQAGPLLPTPLLTNKRHIHLRSASVWTYTFFTTGFPRFLSIHRARGLQAFDLPLLTTTQTLIMIKLENDYTTREND